MIEQCDNQEKMTSIPSRELRALRAENRKLQIDLDQERSKNSMLLYLMGWGRDRVDEKDEWIITLQEKVNQAISMLEYSIDPLEIVKILKEKAEFYERHPIFVIGMKEGQETDRSAEER